MNLIYQNLVQSMVCMPAYSGVSQEGTAVLLVDQQKAFCDPHHPNHYGTKETASTAIKNSKLLSEFRKASIPVFAVYATRSEYDDPDFFFYKPEASDVLVRKDSRLNSPFYQDTLTNALVEKGIKNILVCGFNRAACAKDTAIDAANTKLFNVFFMEDMTANNNQCDVEPMYKTEYMLLENGVKVLSGKNLLTDIKTRKPSNA